ncbi:MAG: type II toxin-antitoxin system RelE/ParE family toxin [Pedosphaera sp.]|nr:type II toxin-antitoxin system RelE/ParE family toxin [Pedosphaera sp.]
MNGLVEIREYVEAGRSPFAEWFDGLDAVTAERVDRYIHRLAAGNFGAAKALRHGVSELRLDFGPGYRVYYGREGRTLILLLGGGTKRRQDADIAAAVERWKRYRQQQN